MLKVKIGIHGVIITVLGIYFSYLIFLVTTYIFT